MNNQILMKISLLLKRPAVLFILFSLLLGLILLFGCYFQLPDFYTDRTLADSIAQTATRNTIYEATEHLINPKYNLYNHIFQIWGWFVSLALFCLIFKVKEFKNFKNLSIFNNKKFVYLWINLSYVLFLPLNTIGYMVDVDKYVYPYYADSMGIPLFTCIAMNVFVGIIHYPLVNLLAFITYNTKIKRFFYNFLWVGLFLYWLLVAYGAYYWKFTYLQIILNLYFFIWFMFIIYSIGYVKNKSIE